ncbi:MAG: protein arginine kinase [Firmicutes bacterium]|nr:protein arginine kinase [Bacillota bacterium]
MQSNTDIVISSRIRLARNAAGLKFPAKLEPERAKKLPREVYAAVSRTGRFTLRYVEALSEIEGGVLKEKHLVSEDLLHNAESGAAVINEDETVSIMVGEEDHIRLQCILSGQDFRSAFETADRIDDDIGKKIAYAFDPNLGYLTACPTNLGTGMRASAMMFLPGLSILNALEACVEAVARLNMTIRGVYGEGSDSAGYRFQVSNQHSLGVTESELLDAVEMSIGHIEDAELKAREVLYKNGSTGIRDKIQRAYGILTNAYVLSSGEFTQAMALCKLGAFYGFIKFSDPERFEKLMVDAQPASLQSISEGALLPETRDIFRAAMVGKVLRSIS